MQIRLDDVTDPRVMALPLAMRNLASFRFSGLITLARRATASGLRNSGTPNGIDNVIRFVDDGEGGGARVEVSLTGQGGGTFQTQILYPCETAFDRHIAHVGDGFAVHRHCQHFRAKAFAATRLAWHLAHV